MVVVAYLGIGFPVPDPHGISGLGVVLYMPRLPLMRAMLLAIYRLLWRGLSEGDFTRNWTRYAWGATMVASVAWSIPSTFRLERAERQDLAYRVPLQVLGFLNCSMAPIAVGACGLRP